MKPLLVPLMALMLLWGACPATAKPFVFTVDDEYKEVTWWVHGDREVHHLAPLQRLYTIDFPDRANRIDVRAFGHPSFFYIKMASGSFGPFADKPSLQVED